MLLFLLFLFDDFFLIKLISGKITLLFLFNDVRGFIVLIFFICNFCFFSNIDCNSLDGIIFPELLFILLLNRFFYLINVMALIYNFYFVIFVVYF